MENDKVIIDYLRHKELLEAEANWLKYKEKHMYQGIIVAVVKSLRGERYDTLKVDIRREFTPNTPEEVKEEITKHVNRLSKKLDAFEEQQREEHERFVEFTKEKYKKIPKWIKKIFI